MSLDRLYFLDNPFGQGLIYLMTVAFIVGLVCLFWHIRRYRGREERSLDQLESNLIHVAEELDRAVAHEALLDGVAPRSLARERVESIVRIVGQSRSADQEQLAAVSYEKERSRLGILLASYITRSLILIGLMGTFVGLTIVVLRFDSLLETVDTTTVDTLLSSMAEATGRIGETTEGLITAFASTFWGLVGTIALGVGMLVLEYHQQALLSRLEGITSVELIPRLNPPQLTEAVEEAARSLARSAESIRGTIEALKDSAQNTLDSVKELDAVVGRLEASSEVFLASGKMIRKGQNDLLETLADLVVKVAAADQREQILLGGLHEVIADGSGQRQQLARILEFLEGSEALNEGLVSRALEEVGAERAGLLREIGEARAAQERSQTEAVTHQQRLVESLVTELREQSTSLGTDFERLSTAISECLERVTESADDDRRERESIAGTLEQVSQGVAESVRLARSATERPSPAPEPRQPRPPAQEPLEPSPHSRIRVSPPSSTPSPERPSPRAAPAPPVPPYRPPAAAEGPERRSWWDRLRRKLWSGRGR